MIALVDVAEAALEVGETLPNPDPTIRDSAMDIEEPIYPNSECFVAGVCDPGSLTNGERLHSQWNTLHFLGVAGFSKYYLGLKYRHSTSWKHTQTPRFQDFRQ